MHIYILLLFALFLIFRVESKLNHNIPRAPFQGLHSIQWENCSFRGPLTPGEFPTMSSTPFLYFSKRFENDLPLYISVKHQPDSNIQTIISQISFGSSLYSHSINPVTGLDFGNIRNSAARASTRWTGYVSCSFSFDSYKTAFNPNNPLFFISPWEIYHPIQQQFLPPEIPVLLPPSLFSDPLINSSKIIFRVESLDALTFSFSVSPFSSIISPYLLDVPPAPTSISTFQAFPYSIYPTCVTTLTPNFQLELFIYNPSTAVTLDVDLQLWDFHNNNPHTIQTTQTTPGYSYITFPIIDILPKTTQNYFPFNISIHDNSNQFTYQFKLPICVPTSIQPTTIKFLEFPQRISTVLDTKLNTSDTLLSQHLLFILGDLQYSPEVISPRSPTWTNWSMIHVPINHPSANFQFISDFPFFTTTKTQQTQQQKYSHDPKLFDENQTFDKVLLGHGSGALQALNIAMFNPCMFNMVVLSGFWPSYSEYTGQFPELSDSNQAFNRISALATNLQCTSIVLISGSEDNVVPPLWTRKLYSILLANSVPVHYFVFPQGHSWPNMFSFSELSILLDETLSKHLGNMNYSITVDPSSLWPSSHGTMIESRHNPQLYGSIHCSQPQQPIMEPIKCKFSNIKCFKTVHSLSITSLNSQALNSGTRRSKPTPFTVDPGYHCCGSQNCSLARKSLERNAWNGYNIRSCPKSVNDAIATATEIELLTASLSSIEIPFIFSNTKTSTGFMFNQENALNLDTIPLYFGSCSSSRFSLPFELPDDSSIAYIDTHPISPGPAVYLSGSSSIPYLKYLLIGLFDIIVTDSSGKPIIYGLWNDANITSANFIYIQPQKLTVSQISVTEPFLSPLSNIDSPKFVEAIFFGILVFSIPIIATCYFMQKEKQLMSTEQQVGSVGNDDDDDDILNVYSSERTPLSKGYSRSDDSNGFKNIDTNTNTPIGSISGSKLDYNNLRESSRIPVLANGSIPRIQTSKINIRSSTIPLQTLSSHSRLRQDDSDDLNRNSNTINVPDLDAQKEATEIEGQVTEDVVDDINEYHSSNLNFASILDAEMGELHP